jgi:hypothetical protein
MQGSIKRWWSWANPTITSTGSPNAQVLTYSVAPEALYAGITFAFLPGYTNTAATTVNPNSLGSISVLAYGVPLTGGEIKQGVPAVVQYDGTNFHLLNPLPHLRQKLIADKIWYVDGDSGDDTTGDGTPGNPWATIQYACDYVNENIDSGGFAVTINQQGTDTTGLLLTSTPPGAAVINLVLNGDVSTTDNAISCFRDGGLKITGNGTVATSGGFCLAAVNAGLLQFQGITLNAASNAQVYAQVGGVIDITGNYSIGANAPHHWACDSQGSITVTGATTVTLNGSLTFTTFASASTGTIYCDHTFTAFSGSATGSRYFCSGAGGVHTNGAATSFLPGSTAGTLDTASYGWYL